MSAADLYLLPGPLAPPKRASPPRRVLLTGATGFVGSHVLSGLLAMPDVTVHCLVRAPDPVAGLARLQHALARWELPAEGLATRVVVEPGRIEAPGLGLVSGRWAALAEGLDAIVHGAAMLHFVHGYETLRPHNVDAVRQILRLAADAGARVLHLSTINAVVTAEESTRQRVFEADPPPPFAALRGAYNQSKWVGERLVGMAADSGVEAAILRLGWVIGDVRRGLVPEDQLQHRVGAAAIASGQVPLPAGALDLVPVEHVSSLILALLTGGPVSGVYHLVHPQPLDAASIEAAVAHAWPHLRATPAAEWMSAMRALARNDRAHPLRALLLQRRLPTGISEFLSRIPAFDCRRAMAAARGLPTPESGIGQIARLIGPPQARTVLDARA